MDGCQNYGPFLDPYYNTALNVWGTQKGIIILTTTQMRVRKSEVFEVIVGGSQVLVRMNFLRSLLEVHRCFYLGHPVRPYPEPQAPNPYP